MRCFWKTGMISSVSITRRLGSWGAGLLEDQFVPTFRKYSSILGKQNLLFFLCTPFPRVFFGYKERAPYSIYIFFDYGAAFALWFLVDFSGAWRSYLLPQRSYICIDENPQAEQLYREARAGGSAKLGSGISRRWGVRLGTRWMRMEWWHSSMHEMLWLNQDMRRYGAKLQNTLSKPVDVWAMQILVGWI